MGIQTKHATIDKFGRLVLPKDFRDQLGIRVNTDFEVECHEEQNAILLRPTHPEPTIVNKGGWLVIRTGSDTRKVDFQNVLEEVRKERDRKIYHAGQ